MIAAKECDDQLRIEAVTCGGARTGVDVIDQGIHQWVRKEAKPLPLFDPRKEKETYKQARKELDRIIMDSIDFDHATFV
jgi:hypothetical protein